MGAQIRTELINALYVEKEQEQPYLKRLIKCVGYINRIMRDGMRDDFMLIQVRNGEIAKNKIEYHHKETYIEEIYFPKIP